MANASLTGGLRRFDDSLSMLVGERRQGCFMISRNGNKRLMTHDQKRLIKAALERVFRHHRPEAGPASEDARTYDFVFHMTDWYEDLVRLADAMQEPGDKSSAEWREAVIGFVVHASGHLLAATELTRFEPVKFDIPKRKRRARPASATSRS